MTANASLLAFPPLSLFFSLNILCCLAVCSLFPFLESLFYLVNLVITGKFMTMAANYDEISAGDIQGFRISYIGTRILVLLTCIKLITPILFFYVYQNLEASKYLKIGLFIASITFWCLMKPS